MSKSQIEQAGEGASTPCKNPNIFCLKSKHLVWCTFIFQLCANIVYLQCALGCVQIEITVVCKYRLQLYNIHLAVYKFSSQLRALKVHLTAQQLCVHRPVYSPLLHCAVYCTVFTHSSDDDGLHFVLVTHCRKSWLHSARKLPRKIFSHNLFHLHFLPTN